MISGKKPVTSKKTGTACIVVPRILLAAPHSGSGKTLLTCGLLRLLQKKGIHPCAFKCGPDFIDPMFHRQVLQVPSRNLDTFFSPDGGTREILAKAMQTAVYAEKTRGQHPTRCGQSAIHDRQTQGCRGSAAHTAAVERPDIAVIEGVMGFFDGTGESGMEASAFDLARQTQTPVILVVDAKGMGRSVSALVRGFQHFEFQAHVSLPEKKETERERISAKGSLTGKKGSLTGKEEEKRVFAKEYPDGKAGADGITAETSLLRGVFLNRISPGMFPLMKRWIEEDTGLPVIGYLPVNAQFSLGSRHLGLLMPEEIHDLEKKTELLADTLSETLDLEKLFSIAREAPDLELPAGLQETAGNRNPSDTVPAAAAASDTAFSGIAPSEPAGTASSGISPFTILNVPDVPRIRIAVARDEAFNFYYEDNLELLQEAGAELVFFSPVHDRTLPAADGLLLGGGYPELHSQALAENIQMKDNIKKCAAEGMPILAECGGFMYLQEYLEAQDGSPQPMCGVLPGTCRRTDRLVRFGYVELEGNALPAGTGETIERGTAFSTGTGETIERGTAFSAGTGKTIEPGNALPAGTGECPESGKAFSGDTGFLAAGHRIRGHEFHYFDSTENGDACTARKPGRNRSWPCMVVRGNIMAGFPHLYYRSDPAFVINFVQCCREQARKRKGEPGHDESR